MKLSIIWLVLFGLYFGDAKAQTLADVKTPVGHGAEYDVSLQTGQAKATIYFVKPPSDQKKAIEMYFEAPGFQGAITMWQQFHLKMEAGKIKVENGYIFAPQFQTRQLDRDYLQGFDGVQMNQFLIGSEQDLKKHFVGKEKVTVKAGTVEAHHYRVQGNGQTVDFWIHHEAKPIGLVKLVSTGEKVFQKYSMSLNRLLTGVGQKIQPSQAQPMDETTRSFLPKPNGQKMPGLGLF